MAELKDLLSKFNNVLNDKSIEKDIIVKVFKRVLNKDIKKEDVSFNKEKLIIKSDVYLKAEINLHKEKLLREIKKEGIDKVIKEIK